MHSCLWLKLDSLFQHFKVKDQLFNKFYVNFKNKMLNKYIIFAYVKKNKDESKF